MKKELTVIVSIFFLVVLARGQDDNTIRYNFSFADSSYTFLGSFLVKTEVDCLIDIAYNFKYAKFLADGAESVELVRQGSDWNEIAYVYRRFIIFENKSVWHRSLSREDGIISFELISSTNNMDIIPKLRSSKGHYKFTKENDLYRVEYYQECLLGPSILTDTYIEVAKEEAIDFLYYYKAYIEKTCK